MRRAHKLCVKFLVCSIFLILHNVKIKHNPTVEDMGELTFDFTSDSLIGSGLWIMNNGCRVCNNQPSNLKASQQHGSGAIHCGNICLLHESQLSSLEVKNTDTQLPLMATMCYEMWHLKNCSLKQHLHPCLDLSYKDTVVLEAVNKPLICFPAVSEHIFLNSTTGSDRCRVAQSLISWLNLLTQHIRNLQWTLKNKMWYWGVHMFLLEGLHYCFITKCSHLKW